MEDIEDVMAAGAPLGLRLPVAPEVGIKPKRMPKARLLQDPLLANPQIPGTQTIYIKPSDALITRSGHRNKPSTFT